MRRRHTVKAGLYSFGLVGAGLIVVALVVGTGRRGSMPPAQSTGAPHETAYPGGARGVPVFDEEFDASELDPLRWNRCHWWGPSGCTISGNNELEWYTPDQVELADGTLRLGAVRRPIVGSDGITYAYRSAMVTTGRSSSDRRSKPKFTFRFGYLEARVRVPKGDGLWPALWLLPPTNRSRPEVDVFEIRGSQTNKLSMHVHATNAEGQRISLGEHWTGQDLAVGWHTFGLDWQAGSLTWFVDGVQAWQVTGEMVPSEPLYIVANLAVGGDWPGPPTPETRFPATFEIDYVRVWPGK